MIRHLLRVVLSTVVAVLPLAALDFLWSFQFQRGIELWKAGIAALTPWFLVGLFVGLGLFLVEVFLRRFSNEDEKAPLNRVVFCTIGSGGKALPTLAFWTISLLLARVSASGPFGLEPGEIAVFVVVFLLAALLGIRWARFRWCLHLRHPIAFVPFCLLALFLINTDGLFLIPHDLWPFIPILIAGGSLGISALVSEKVQKVAAIFVTGMSLIGWNLRSEEVHFWLNSYVPGQYGAWQLTQFATDFDADGFSSILGGKDCAPFDSSVSPVAPETVGNGVDETCGGSDLATFQPIRELGTPQGRFNEEGRRPNLIFITVDTLRADAVGAKGGSFTPVLDELASRGQRFTRAYTPAPHTAEALPAAMTGMYPSDWNQKGTFFGFQPTIAAELKELGFSTSAVLSLPFIEPSLLYGFDYVDNSQGERVDKNARLTTSSEITTLALNRIDALDNEPFFLWIHYFDPHAPWIPSSFPPGSDTRARYAQEVHRTDMAIGQLLEGLLDRNLINNTALVVFSDHGEGLGEHRSLTHAWDLWESQIRIPLIFRLPGVPPAESDTPVSLIDLVPTLYDYLGIIESGKRRGVSLIPLMRGAEIEDRSLFFESNYRPKPYGLGRAVLYKDNKLIFDLRRSAYGLFDLSVDPGEQNNLVGQNPELLRQLNEVLSDWWAQSYNDIAIVEKAKVWEERNQRQN